MYPRRWHSQPIHFHRISVVVCCWLYSPLISIDLACRSARSRPQHCLITFNQLPHRFMRICNSQDNRHVTSFTTYFDDNETLHRRFLWNVITTSGKGNKSLRRQLAGQMEKTVSNLACYHLATSIAGAEALGSTPPLSQFNVPLDFGLRAQVTCPRAHRLYMTLFGVVLV